MKKVILKAALIFFFTGIISFSVSVSYFAFIKRYLGPDTTFTIAPGTPFSTINYRLKKENLIVSSRLFHRIAQLKHKMTELKAGTFIIPRGVNLVDVLNILTSDNQVLVKITVPEGKNIYEIASLLEEKGLCSTKDFLIAANEKEFLRSLEIPFNSAEGFLFPETYYFSPLLNPKEIIKTMVHLFFKKIKSLKFHHPNLSFYELIILASIVEKETGLASERNRIAGVFYNRLKKQMRLQSDPTTIYGIWHRYKGNLRKRDLLEKTDYNTYKISGLPPGPIANPGPGALNAVINPENHNYLYFVSRNDGSHIFSQNYRDHTNHVNRFQKSRISIEKKNK